MRPDLEVHRKIKYFSLQVYPFLLPDKSLSQKLASTATQVNA